MNDRDREILIEAAATAFRERDPSGRILFSPAWADLPGDAREELFERQREARTIERLASEDGLSSTARLVATRVADLRQLGAGQE
jgi:hypothetical protein